MQVVQKHLKDFMSAKPELLKKYVDTSLLALNYLLVPLSAFTKHLLELQGLDPNTVPGQRELMALQQAFDKVHEEEYDEDYDVSWVQKKFEKVRESSRWGDLTQETFVGLTNISDLSTGSESSDPLTIGISANQIAPESEKREIRVFGDMEQERDNLKIVENSKVFSPGIDLKVIDLAKELDSLINKYKKTSKQTKKSGVKTSKKKLNKRKAKK